MCDIIYGNFEIKEPVLTTLIDSEPVQRLKRITQYGVPEELYPIYPSFSRYEHSLGVMLLPRKFEASLEEQVAGLIHDVSHTAFSHVVDWVIGNSDKEDYQDKNHKNVIYNSGIPEILSNFGFNTERIVNIENYSLLEREIPDLCADRIDYVVREFHYWLDPGFVKPCLDNLIIFDRKFVFSSKEIAETFGRNYLRCQREHWGGIDAILRYHLFSQILEEALNKNIILKKDFYKDNEHIMKKLRESKNHKISKILDILSEKLNLRDSKYFEFTEQNPQLSLRKKFRYVDPEYVENGNLYRLGEVDSDYKTFLEEQRKINEKGVNVNLLF